MVQRGPILNGSAWWIQIFSYTVYMLLRSLCSLYRTKIISPHAFRPDRTLYFMAAWLCTVMLLEYRTYKKRCASYIALIFANLALC